MKMSLNWIQDFVDVADYQSKPAQLADLLTRAGLEVEEIVDRRKDFEHVVVGLILEKEKHPNADRLSVCKVTTGEGVIHQIVCGATNHKAGDRVVAALPGAVLPGNFAIKKSTVRGVESGGMLCSTSELGLSKDSDGIMILPTDATVGKAFADQMGFSDVVFELKVTPNRADCLSHFGLAREIAALLDRPLKGPALKGSAGGAKTLPVEVQVKAADLCPRYAAAVIEGVKVGPSPEWLVRRLESVGMNSINNVVDITNYVLMEMGQPMHAFDLAQIVGRKIQVSKASGGEAFTTLDDREIKLKGDELVIADGEKVIALAGVMGGKNSGVTEASTAIVLESANFSSSSVRKTSRGFGIESDSAYRFSRGVDLNGTVIALQRARELVLELAGGQAVEGHFDSLPQPPVRESIAVTTDYVSERLGYEVEVSKFENFMSRLGCGLEKQGEGEYRVSPPSYRFDLERDVDLVEEYARINGYDQIPEVLPPMQTAPLAHDALAVRSRQVHQTLQKAGYLQAINHGFASSKNEREFLGPQMALRAAGLNISDEAIPLRNPLSDDLNVMRSALSQALYRNASSNIRHGVDEGALYELGSVFVKDKDAYTENLRLGLVQWGRPKSLFTKTHVHPVVYDLKAAVESLLAALRIRSYTWVVPKDKGEVPAFCHRNQFAQLLVEGKKIGFLASIHPSVLEDEKIRVPMAIAEIHIEGLLRAPERPYRAEALSKMPAVERDLAVVMPKTLAVGDVMKEMNKQGGPLLQSLDVFDVFVGGNLEADKKSVAFRLTFQDKNATLQEEQVQELMSKIIRGVTQSFGIQVR